MADEEALPLAAESIDLFASALALQWANDLPGALIQIRQALKPDGLFLAAMTGGRTLAELREALYVAETEIRGGASPRVMPAVDLRDMGALLQRAGFALPVVDRDIVTVRYDSAFELWRDLRAMGATNVLARARPQAGGPAPLPPHGRDLCGALQRSGRARAGDVRDRMAVGMGAAREPAEAGAARIGTGEPGTGARRDREGDVRAAVSLQSVAAAAERLNDLSDLS